MIANAQIGRISLDLEKYCLVEQEHFFKNHYKNIYNLIMLHG